MTMTVTKFTNTGNFLLFIGLLLFSSSLAGQKIPIGVSEIKITGVSFRQVADSLIKYGFYFESIDSNFKTIKTGKQNGFSMYARIRDSAATFTGFYNDSQVSN